VIYGTVKHIHGTVVFLPIWFALPQNSKPDRVLLGTGLHRAKSERKTPFSKSTLVGDGIHRTGKQYHEFMEVKTV
jgi:hypothetical protein